MSTRECPPRVTASRVHDSVAGMEEVRRLRHGDWDYSDRSDCRLTGCGASYAARSSKFKLRLHTGDHVQSTTVLPELVKWHIDCTTKLNGAYLSQYKPHVASIPTSLYSQNQYSQPNPLTLSHPLSNAPTTSSGSGPFSRSTRSLSKRATLLAPIKTASLFSPPAGYDAPTTPAHTPRAPTHTSQ